MQAAEDDRDFGAFLPKGTRLQSDGYRIVDHIGGGGFGLTYLAEDRMGRRVVLKECFPSNICHRASEAVRVHTRSQQEDFGKLVKVFMNEARQLASLKHPNVVTVHHFFEENGTAYMALEYIKGRDLAQLIEDRDGVLPSELVVDIAERMIDALGHVHQKGILHRDVAPDNVIVDTDGAPILVDFGAARSEVARSVTRLLSDQLRAVKDGYSPQEFYIPGSPQGPESDLYSLGATLYHAITGAPPVDAYTRMLALGHKTEDPYRPLAGRFPNYSESFLAAVDRALAVFGKDRFSGTDEWAAALSPGRAKPRLLLLTPSTADASDPEAREETDAAFQSDLQDNEPSTAASGAAARPKQAEAATAPSDGPRGTEAAVQPQRVRPRTRTDAEESQTAGKQSRPSDPTNRQSDTLPPPVSSQRSSGIGGRRLALLAATVLVAAGGGITYATFGDFAGDDAPIVSQPSLGEASVPAKEDVAESAGETPATSTGAGPGDTNRVRVSPAMIAAATALSPDTSEQTGATAPASAAPVEQAGSPTTRLDVPSSLTVNVAADPQTGQAVVMDGEWAVSFPFELVEGGADTGGLTTFAGGGSSPYPAGTVLTAVGGERPEGDATAVAARYLDAADPARPIVPISVRSPLFDVTGTAEVAVTARRTATVGSHHIAQVADGDVWRLEIAEAPDTGPLRAGDLLRGEQVSGRRIDRLSDLDRILSELRQRGRQSATFLVWRSGRTDVLEVELDTLR